MMMFVFSKWLPVDFQVIACVLEDPGIACASIVRIPAEQHVAYTSWRSSQRMLQTVPGMPNTSFDTAVGGLQGGPAHLHEEA